MKHRMPPGQGEGATEEAEWIAEELRVRRRTFQRGSKTGAAIVKEDQVTTEGDS